MFTMASAREARPRYDEQYKQLFAFPRMVEDLLRAFVAIYSAPATSRRCGSCRPITSATHCSHAAATPYGGCARDHYPKELVEHRNASVSQALMVMIDGDRDGIRGRMDELDDACTKAETSPRNSEDQVLVFIPTWRIETWLAYLG